MTEKEKQPADSNSTIRLLLGLLAVPAFMVGKEIYKKYKKKKESEDTNGKINKKEVKETLPDSLTGDLFTGAVEMYCKSKATPWNCKVTA